MGCLSGRLMSAASDQKLFCELSSPFCCSFYEFVEEKVISPSCSSAILTPPPSGYVFNPGIHLYQQEDLLQALHLEQRIGNSVHGSNIYKNHLFLCKLQSKNFFHILMVLKNLKNKNILWHMKILCTLKFINTVLQEHN